MCLCGSCNTVGPSKQSSLICASGLLTQTAGAASSSSGSHLSRGSVTSRGGGQSAGKTEGGRNRGISSVMWRDVIVAPSHLVSITTWRWPVPVSGHSQKETGLGDARCDANFLTHSPRAFQFQASIFTSSSLSSATGKAACFLRPPALPPVDSAGEEVRNTTWTHRSVASPVAPLKTQVEDIRVALNCSGSCNQTQGEKRMSSVTFLFFCFSCLSPQLSQTGFALVGAFQGVSPAEVFRKTCIGVK